MHCIVHINQWHAFMGIIFTSMLLKSCTVLYHIFSTLQNVSFVCGIEENGLVTGDLGKTDPSRVLSRDIDVWRHRRKSRSFDYDAHCDVTEMNVAVTWGSFLKWSLWQFFFKVTEICLQNGGFLTLNRHTITIYLQTGEKKNPMSFSHGIDVSVSSSVLSQSRLKARLGYTLMTRRKHLSHVKMTWDSLKPEH